MREIKHILVVEDDDVLRKSLELMLRDDYDIHCEKYGKMAISYLQCQQVDIILLDIKMPFLDGFETMKRIRNIPEYEMTPIIFLTGETNKEIKQKCLELGAKEFLNKPIGIERLRKTLDGVLYEKRGITQVFKRNKNAEVAEVTRNFMPIAESILLVGNNEELLQEMKKDLKGYLPRTAVGRDAALDYLDKLRPAVIYIEDELAKYGDYNLIHKLRMQPYAWKIPVVIFSEKEDFLKEENLEEYRNEGIRLFMKDTSKESILDCLKEALS